MEAEISQDSGAHSQIRPLGDLLWTQDKGKYLTLFDIGKGINESIHFLH